MLDRDLDNRDHSIEFTYLGFGNWSGKAGLKSQLPQSLIATEDQTFGGWTDADTYETFYRSNFNSMELDYRVRNRPGRDRMIMGPDGFWSQQISPGRTQSFIMGLRGISEQEFFRWLSRRDNVNFDTFGGDMQIDSKNWLLGAQIGGDCLDVHESWYWGIRGDAGIYCNFSDGAYRRLVNDDTTPEPFLSSHATGQTAAFYGELSFLLGHDITDHLMIHASWDLAFLGGVSLAPDMASFHTWLANPQPFLNTGGQIFYTGLSVGFDAYW